MSPEKKIPKPIYAVYIDTSILFDILNGSQRISFLKLRDFCLKYKIDLYIPEIVYQEWISKNLIKINENMEKIQKELKKISDILEIDKLEYNLDFEFREVLEKILNDFIKQSKLRKIPINEKIDFNKLIENAVNYRATFKEKDKGFKDYLILTTIIDNMKKNRLNKSIILTKDSDFSSEKVHNFIREYDIEILTFKNLEETIEKIEGLIDQVYEHFKQKEQTKLLNFLNKKKEDIFRYIMDNNPKISDSFLLGSFLSPPEDRIEGDIERIISVTPKEISDAYTDSLSSNIIPEGWKPITISSAFEFRVIIRKLNTLRFLIVGKLKQFSLSDPEKFNHVETEYPEYHEYEQIITRNIFVEAHIKEEEEKLLDLRLIKVLSY